MKSQFSRKIHSEAKLYSPIVIDDSSEISNDDLQIISLSDKEPSSNGNVSYDYLNVSPAPSKTSQPSIGGWSPAQHIITANPKHDPIPSTPKDVADESYEHCSMKKVQDSQKKILNELYGDGWKSIPDLFKTIKHKYDNFNGITKKLFDDDDNENDTPHWKVTKQLYLKSFVDRDNQTNFCESEKKSKKKLFTEKVPSTPEVSKQLPKTRNVNSTTKKVRIKKGMTITELVGIMNKDSRDVCNENTFMSKIDNGFDHSTRKRDVVDRNTKKKDDVDILMKKIEKNLNCLEKNGEAVHIPRDHVDTPLKNIQNVCRVVKKGENLSMTKNTEDNVDKLLNKNYLNSVTKKKRNVNGKTEECDNVDILTKKIENVRVTPQKTVIPERLSFMASLADNVPSWRCNLEAIQYIDNYTGLRDQLTRRLYSEFNKSIFDDALDADMSIIWDSKFRSTAGTTTNRRIKNAKGDCIRYSMIKLSTKVVDTPERLRDTLIHEMCHAATWLIDGELRAGHGPLWKAWASRALKTYPELGEISTCHSMVIHYKYIYKCTTCGYSIQRHSKSIDITKKCCGYCRGKFAIVLNKKNKDGVIKMAPAKKRAPNEFAQYVKQNYANMKDATKTHAQVMKMLGEQFSAKKTKPVVE